MPRYLLLPCFLFFFSTCALAAQKAEIPPMPEPSGNRLYWNTVQSPQALEMRGATWKDPALVPPLNTRPGSASQPKKRVRKAAPAKAQAQSAPPKPAQPKDAPTPTAEAQPPAGQTIPPLRAPNPHDEDRVYKPIKDFDPFAQGEPVYRDRLQ